MNLLIIKVEEFANERERMVAESRRMAQIKLPQCTPPTEEGKATFNRMVEDLRDVKGISK